MTEDLVPTVRTTITVDTYVRAVIRAWKRITSTWPSLGSVGVLWAHYALETGGGAHCYCFNLGNVKHVAGDGHDYCELHGVWEGVTAEAFAMLQHPPLGHLIRLDPNPDHQKAVGKGKLAAIFDPPHPASRFRAYPSLEAALVEHLQLLKDKRYKSAWPAVEQGDVALFATELRARGYYTASLKAYVNGMQAWFDRYVIDGAYERAVEQISAEQAAATEPEMPAEPDTDVEQRILHPIVPFPSYRSDEEGGGDNVMVRDLLEVHEASCASWGEAPCDCKNGVVTPEEDA